MKIIIARTDTNALLKASNNILSKYSEEEVYSVPKSIKGQVVLSTLKKLQKSSSFYISGIRGLSELTGIRISTEHEQLFSSLHCVDWADINPETRDYIMAVLVNYFAEPIMYHNQKNE